jgi:hypothetical protein
MRLAAQHDGSIIMQSKDNTAPEMGQRPRSSAQPPFNALNDNISKRGDHPLKITARRRLHNTQTARTTERTRRQVLSMNASRPSRFRFFDA